MMYQVSMILGIPSSDCANVIRLATDLEMDSNSAEMIDIKDDCCHTTSGKVQCSIIEGSERVTFINWGRFNPGLNGFINGNALPSSLTYLQLNQNAITGTLPVKWPQGMIHIEVNRIILVGDIL